MLTRVEALEKTSEIIHAAKLSGTYLYLRGGSNQKRQISPAGGLVEHHKVEAHATNGAKASGFSI